MLLALAVYAAARVGGMAVGLAVAAAREDVEPVDVFRFWDGGWYLSVVEQGYPRAVPPEVDPPPPPGVAISLSQLSSNFFPAYPLLVRSLSWLTGADATAAGVAVSIATGGAAVLVVMVLARSIASEATALRTGVLVSLFPGSVVLSTMYAEGLQLLFSALCLLALLQRRWLLAGVAGALATATRPAAIAVVAACAWAAGQSIWERREWRALIAPALAPLGFLGYVGWLGQYTGEPEAWFRISRQGWGVRYGDFHEFLGPVRDIGVLSEGYWQLWLIGIALLALCWVAFRHGARMPAVLWVYTGAILAPLMLSRVFGPRPRYLLLAFPLFFLLGRAYRGRRFVALTVAFAVLLTVEVVMHLIPQYATP